MAEEYITKNEFELKLATVEAKLDGRFQRLEDKIDRLEDKMDLFIENTNQHFATKAEMFMLETRLIKWVVGAVLTSSGLAATIAFGLAKLFA